MGDALELLAGLVLEDGRRWGDAAEPFQWQDARAVLSGGWRQAYLTRPRGASKTTDLAGIGIAALLEQLPPRSRSYAAAVDADQGRLLVDALDGFVARTPGLGGALAVDRWVVTNRRTGATLEVLPADAAGSLGLLPHLLIVDEYAAWPGTTAHRALWRHLFGALPKVAGSRLVVITAAGDPTSDAGKLMARAQASDRWFVHEVPGPTPWHDPADLEEQRAELPAWEFARFVLNQWTSAADRLSSVEDVRACVRHVGPLPPVAGVKYVVALDVGITNDRTVATVAHADRTDEGVFIVVDRQEVWQGTRKDPVPLGEVESWVLEASRGYNRAPLVFDPYQAIHVSQRLRSLGVRVFPFTFSQPSIGRLALTVYRLLRDHLLDLPDEAGLLEELATVRIEERSPGQYRIDHDAGKHDDRVISLALAAQHLLEHGGRRRRLVFRDGRDEWSGPDKSWMAGSGGRRSGSPRRLGPGGSTVAFASNADLAAGVEAAGVEPGAPVSRAEVDGLAMDEGDREKLRRFMGGG